jgi:hypothetical protein
MPVPRRRNVPEPIGAQRRLDKFGDGRADEGKDFFTWIRFNPQSYKSRGLDTPETQRVTSYSRRPDFVTVKAVCGWGEQVEDRK